MHSISSHDLLEYVKIQCDEKYAGRLTGTAGYQECTEWLASMFGEWGLIPAGENGTWFQWFDIPYTLVYPDCGVSLHLKQGKEGTIIIQEIMEDMAQLLFMTVVNMGNYNGSLRP